MYGKSITGIRGIKRLIPLGLAVLLAIFPGLCATAVTWQLDPQLDPQIPHIILSSDADLSYLGLASGALSPDFDAGVTSYSSSYCGASTQVKANTAESHATITVNGTAVASGQWSLPIALNPGANTVTVTVTAQNKLSTKTYTITVNKPAPGDANLRELCVSIGALSPGFDPGTLNYSATEANATTSIKVVASPLNEKATFTINGKSTTYDEIIALNEGPNTVSVVVTSEDKSAVKTYTIVITRQGSTQVSTNASLSDLITNAGALTPGFAPATTAYTQPYVGPNIVVKATVAESHATITVNGQAASSGQWAQAVTLVSGVNTIPVKVTAQDGTTTKTYTISITMPQVNLSSDADLSSLTLSSGALTPAFSPTTTAYTQSVGNAVAVLDKIDGKTNNANANATINGKSIGCSGLVFGEKYPLNVGDNVFTILVTAQDGKTTKTYTITVTRAAAQPAQTAPAAPSGLTAAADSGSEIKLAWTDNASNEDGFIIERKTAGGSYAQVGSTMTNVCSFTDSGLAALTAYYYRVCAYNTGGHSAYSNEAQATTTEGAPPLPPESTQTNQTGQTTQTSETVLRFYIGSTAYYINDQAQTMDASPIITEGRTLLPIRYVATPLGASVDWNEDEQKVTISLKGKTIELWIGQGNAKISGVDAAIDSQNPNVTPIIVPPGRTMLPLRFIAENLGSQVGWNDSNQEVKITYPRS